MKYSPKLYAQALGDVAAGALSADKEKKIARNFLELVRKNGDDGQMRKILAEAERRLREKTGLRKITIETAREMRQPPARMFKQFIQKSDIVEEKTDPSLIAGVKITVNDGMQLDATLRRKLNRLFANH